MRGTVMFYTKKQSLKARILVAAVSLFMVFGNVVTPLSGAFYVYGENMQVSFRRNMR